MLLQKIHGDTMKKTLVLSVIIPVYNEARTIESSINKVKKASLKGIKKQIIVVDDGSTDGTAGIIKKITAKDRSLIAVFKPKNGGKGTAIREGIKHASGDFTIIQDADLEYDPEDYGLLLEPILRGSADVVYGSRFLGTHRSFMLLHLVANKILTLITNILYNNTLTDMETCYKVFKTPILKEMKLKSSRFEIEPELTAKVLKKHYRIYEVPIHFYGRGYEEGKKIKAIDGFIALWALIKYRFVD
jgi:glycosyltransferase involved in cell wall biosynthesis